MRYDIFISYRREGGADKARTLKECLEARKFRVFLDFDELKDGVFDRRIMDAIESAPIFIFLLTPHALDRCIDTNDWVRKEIEYAIEKERHIIPVNPNLSFEGFPNETPESVRQGLGQHQFSEIMFGQLFRDSVEKMINERILPILNPVNREKEANTYLSEKGALINILPDVDCRIEKYGKPIGNAAAGRYTPIRLLKGKHILTFISEENEQDRIEITYSVADNDMEDFIKVELLPIVNARKAGEQERQKQLLSTPDENIEKYKDEKDKFGFRIKSTGEVIVLPKYDCAENFNEGLASVKLNVKWGYIDKTGKEITPFKYDIVENFHEGLAWVKLNDKYGFIDKTGKEVIPLIYDAAWPFSGSFARVKLNGKWFYIDKNGKEKK